MDNLVVDGHLATFVRDDEDTDAATAVVEAVLEAVEQAALVEDRETLLDVAGLSHSNNGAVVADVKHTVLLEDRAEHVLDNNRRARVADEAGLLVELLAEEVDTEVAVLASLCRGGDSDDLAGTALQNQQVADPDVVAGDGDGVGNHGGARGRVTSLGRCWTGLVARSGGGDFAVLDDYVFFDTLGAGVRVVVVMTAVDGVQDSFGGAVESVTERVVVTVFVVISHITLVLELGLSRVDGGLVDTDLLVEVVDRLALWVPLGWIVTRVGALVLPRTGVAVVLLGEGSSTGAEVALSYVETTVEVDLGSGSMTGRVVALVSSVLDVELGVGVTLVRLTVTIK